MAYITQQEKKEIAIELKKIMPKTYKWSLSIEHYSKLILKISQSQDDLLTNSKSEFKRDHREVGYVNDETFVDKSVCELFKKIEAIMNKDNYNHSDIMTDYFDVGYYVGIYIGTFEKPYIQV